MLISSLCKYCFPVHKINQRHELLSRLIGTKSLEDKSFENSKEVLKATTAFVIVFSIMEVAIYFIYLNYVSMKMYINYFMVHTIFPYSD